jgi:hypothetical protein
LAQYYVFWKASVEFGKLLQKELLHAEMEELDQGGLDRRDLRRLETDWDELLRQSSRRLPSLSK